MQGNIFVLFSEMVVELKGMAFWNTLLEEVQPASGGAYTSGARYDDAELLAMVQRLSEKTDIPIPDLVRSFGEYLAPHLLESSPTPIDWSSGSKQFLLTIDDIIHAEVKRLNPDVLLPSFRCQDEGDKLIMEYHSERKLCHLAEGLIIGTVNAFGETVDIVHDQCMHKGAESCLLELTIKKMP